MKYWNFAIKGGRQLQWLTYAADTDSAALQKFRGLHPHIEPYAGPIPAHCFLCSAQATIHDGGPPKWALFCDAHGNDSGRWLKLNNRSTRRRK